MSEHYKSEGPVRDPTDTRTASELEAAHAVNFGPSPLKVAAALYDLDQAERLTLILAVAPFYLGSAYSRLSPTTPVVDVDRYAREIVARRPANP